MGEKESNPSEKQWEKVVQKLLDAQADKWKATLEAQEKRWESYTDKLLGVLDSNQRLQLATTTAIDKLSGVIEVMNKAVDVMQNTQSTLIGQITTSISMSKEGVPLKVFMVVVIVMAAFILSILGFAAADVIKLGGIP